MSPAFIKKFKLTVRKSIKARYNNINVYDGWKEIFLQDCCKMMNIGLDRRPIFFSKKNKKIRPVRKLFCILISDDTYGGQELYKKS